MLSRHTSINISCMTVVSRYALLTWLLQIVILKLSFSRHLLYHSLPISIALIWLPIRMLHRIRYLHFYHFILRLLILNFMQNLPVLNIGFLVHVLFIDFARSQACFLIVLFREQILDVCIDCVRFVHQFLSSALLVLVDLINSSVTLLFLLMVTHGHLTLILNLNEDLVERLVKILLIDLNFN